MVKQIQEPDDNIVKLVQRLHKRPEKVVCVVAGAGTKAVNDLLGVAGASRTLLEGLIPYSKSSFDRFLGRTPKKYVSKEVSQLLAGRALARAQLLSESDAPLIGIACTATIITDRIKKGAHRAHVAVWQKERLKSYYLLLNKGERSREEEEAVVSALLLNALAESMHVDTQLPLGLLSNESLEKNEYNYKQAAENVYRRDRAYFGILKSGGVRQEDASPEVILSGSFNPLHEGHLKLARAASDFLDKPIAFELSAFNVDKPPLEQNNALYRLSQFAGHYSVYLTNAPTFIEKARIFGETTFVVGYDTAVRILMPKYYDQSPRKMMDCLQELYVLGCRFLVATRLDEKGKVKHIADLPVPTKYKSLFTGLPDFRADISSTELRNKGLKGSR